MNPFLGFEKILMHVIEETIHDVDMGRDGKPYKSKEERFDDAMSAILGEQYEYRFQRTSNFHASELIAIQNLKEQGCSLRSAVAKVAEYQLPKIRKNKEGKENSADKNAYEAEITRLESQVKKHLKRQKQHYKDSFTDYSERDAIFSEIIEDEKQKCENIFKALRAAGWSIY